MISWLWNGFGLQMTSLLDGGRFQEAKKEDNAVSFFF
jgi:hypothetical protein